jgi:dTDP-D-glucose 4,6-dehydratase
MQGQSDEKLVEKVRIIYASLARDDQYFNDFLTICELVKSETGRMGITYNIREKELKQGLEYMTKIKNVISEKE